jgi:hypothetical protein
MDTVAAVVLTLLTIVALINLANGTLGAWLAAKFLHKAPSS